MTVSLGEGLFQPQVYTDPLLEPDPVPPRDPDIERHEQVLGALYAIQDALLMLASRPEVGPPPTTDLGALVVPAPTVTVDLTPVVEALERHDQTFVKFSERLGVLGKQVAALAISPSGGSSGNVIVDGGSLDSIRQPIVTSISDNRTLVERMKAFAPAPGYTLYVDTADPTYIYTAEAPSAYGDSAPEFRGMRVPKDANGNPLGRVQTAQGFAWDSRTTASWG